MREETAPGWGMIAALLVLPLFAGFLALLAATKSPIPISYAVAIAMTTQAIVAFLLYGLAEPFRASLRRRFAPVGAEAIGAGFGAALLIKAIVAGLGLLIDALGADLAEPPADPLLPAALPAMLALLPAVSLLEPAWEELLFRGLLLDRLRRALPVRASVMLSSLLFALVHDNHPSLGWTGALLFLDRFAVGAAAAWLALRYRSLIPAFALHMASNLIAQLGMVLFPS